MLLGTVGSSEQGVPVCCTLGMTPGVLLLLGMMPGVLLLLGRVLPGVLLLLLGRVLLLLLLGRVLLLLLRGRVPEGTVMPQGMMYYLGRVPETYIIM